jgi:hypothetical protein
MTKTEIFKLVIERISPHGAAVRTIDDELVGVLRDLSVRGEHLQTTAEITTAAGTTSYSLPADFRHEVMVSLAGGDALVRMSFGDYQTELADDRPVNAWAVGTTYGLGERVTYNGLTWASERADNIGHTPSAGAWWAEDLAGRGEPQAYAIWNNQLYVAPIPDGIYTIDLAYVYFHGGDLAAITFSDRYREAVVQGVCAALWVGQLGSSEIAADRWTQHTERYEAELARASAVLRPVHRSVRYRDL